MKIQKIAFRNDMDVTANAIAKEISIFIRKWHSIGRFKRPSDFEYNIDLDPKKQQIDKNLPQNEQIKRKNEGVIDLDTVIEVKIIVNVIEARQYTPKFKTHAAFNYSGQFAIDHSGQIIDDKPINLRNPSITVNIEISTEFSTSDYNAFYIDLINAIRHELGHTDQYINKNITPPKYNADKLSNPRNDMERFEENIKYLSDNLELEPFIRGFMLQAKKSGSSITEVVRKFIDNQLGLNNQDHVDSLIVGFGYRREIGEKMIISMRNKLIVKFIEKAKQLFPNISKNNS